MKTRAIIEKSKHGTIDVFTPDLDPVIYGVGDTVHEAKENLLNTLEDILQY